VQWIRVLLICLVVTQHSAEPYVVTGGEWLIHDPASSELLLVLFILSGTYFMGFFFLISGYFLDASIDRHGFSAVAKSRLVRLGIPLIFFVVFVNGAIGYLVEGKDLGPFRYIQVYLLGGQAEFGPLWFTAHLLIYILVYLALRALLTQGSTRQAVAPEPPIPSMTGCGYSGLFLENRRACRNMSVFSPSVSLLGAASGSRSSTTGWRSCGSQ
jgi:fucose 4-O-acetylase-like acetyltransferase